jgi:hypothetical protein
LHSILTSSHSHRCPAEAGHPHIWCLQETAFVDVEMTREVIARTSPPAFLFPIQRCQRPEPACRPHRLTPGVGGGGYLVAPIFRVNRLFEAFVSAPTEAGEEAKAWPRVPEEKPSKSVAESVGGGFLPIQPSKGKRKVPLVFRRPGRRRHQRGAACIDRFFAFQPCFSAFFRKPRRLGRRPKLGPCRSAFTPSGPRAEPAEGGVYRPRPRLTTPALRFLSNPPGQLSQPGFPAAASGF